MCFHDTTFENGFRNKGRVICSTSSVRTPRCAPCHLSLVRVRSRWCRRNARSRAASRPPAHLARLSPLGFDRWAPKPASTCNPHISKRRALPVLERTLRQDGSRIAAQGRPVQRQRKDRLQ